MNNLNLEERLELAKEMKKRGYNCAQVVACVFAEDYGVDEALLMKMSEAFGGGVAATQSVCGAVTGMMILAGLDNADGNTEKPATKGSTYKIGKRLQADFIEKNGTVICKDLKSGEGPKGVVPCMDCILSAVEMYHNYLNEEK